MLLGILFYGINYEPTLIFFKKKIQTSEAVIKYFAQKYFLTRFNGENSGVNERECELFKLLLAT